MNPRLLLLLILLPACKLKLPDINLATPKPIEVNLNMRLDVYQYSGDQPKPQDKDTSLGDAIERQRNRQQEIQTIKNNRELHAVQTEQWKLRIERAFKGEYIEVPGDKEGSFKWIQSMGPKEKKAE